VSLKAVGKHYSKQRCEALFALRPTDLKGSINLPESCFLHKRILAHDPDQVVELGTCSGFSTAVIADALAVLDSVFGGTRKVLSYDNSTTCFFDRSKPVGYFLEYVPEEVISRGHIRTNCTSLDLRQDIPPNSLRFLFIDASHCHPWPSLDFLMALPFLDADAEVCFHDVNLPLANPRFPDFGVKYLFDSLVLDKCYADPIKGRVSNMGSVTLARNREQVWEQILSCIRTYPWEKLIQREWLVSAGIFSEIEDCWELNAKRLGPI
jgi:hypothetical protein